ncbi:hypothetical protein ABH975_002342 [Bradyrhizobium ottawaense]
MTAPVRSVPIRAMGARYGWDERYRNDLERAAERERLRQIAEAAQQSNGE